MPGITSKEEKYFGKYVATKSFRDTKVISYGKNPTKVLHEARKKGAKDPVIYFVPKKNSIHIY